MSTQYNFIILIEYNYLLLNLFHIFLSLLQDNKCAVKEESEEYKNFDEHVDIKHEINPTSQLVATTSEVRQGCEHCSFNPHIHIQIIFFQITRIKQMINYSGS